MARIFSTTSESATTSETATDRDESVMATTAVAVLLTTPGEASARYERAPKTPERAR